MTSRDEPTEAKRISDVIIDLVLVTFELRWGINITIIITLLLQKIGCVLGGGKQTFYEKLIKYS